MHTTFTSSSSQSFMFPFSFSLLSIPLYSLPSISSHLPSVHNKNINVMSVGNGSSIHTRVVFGVLWDQSGRIEHVEISWTFVSLKVSFFYLLPSLPFFFSAPSLPLVSSLPHQLQMVRCIYVSSTYRGGHFSPVPLVPSLLLPCSLSLPLLLSFLLSSSLFFFLFFNLLWQIRSDP